MVAYCHGCYLTKNCKRLISTSLSELRKQDTLDAFTNLDKHQHTNIRKIVSHVYSTSNFIQLEERVDTDVQTLIDKLEECAMTRKAAAIDVAGWV